MISGLFGTWAAARTGLHFRVDVDVPQAGSADQVELIGHTGDLCAQSTAIARKIRGCEEVQRLA